MLTKWNLSPIENLPDGVKNVLLVDASIVRQTGNQAGAGTHPSLLQP